MPLNILLADDSMTAQNMAKKILSEAGYEVSTVSNGAAALKKIFDRTPDLVILDIYMPGYTGLEVCERLKRSATTSRVPVLLSVGKLEPYREQDAAEAGADGVIVKPFEATELVTIVTNVILRTSGGGMDVATVPQMPPVATPAVAEEPNPAPVQPVDHPPELAKRKSPAQVAASELADSATKVSERAYFDHTISSDERSAMTTVTATATGSADFAAPGQPVAEADSSLPFSIDKLLDVGQKAPPVETPHLSGPGLDVYPLEPGAEEIEVIEIPAFEPSVVTVGSTGADDVAAPQDSGIQQNTLLPDSVVAPEETVAVETALLPEELGAFEVETSLGDHEAAASAVGSTPALDVDLSHASEQQETQAVAVTLANVEVGATDLSAQVFPVEPPSAQVDVADELPATPDISVEQDGKLAADNESVFEADDAAFNLQAHEDDSAPFVPDFLAQSNTENASSPTQPAAIEPAFMPVFASTPVGVAAKTALDIPEPVTMEAPEKISAAIPVPEPPLTSQKQSAGEPVDVGSSEDFTFSVPLVIETAAPLSVPILSDLESQCDVKSDEPVSPGIPGPSVEVSPASVLDDEAAIAGAVQRVMEKFKPQIVAEIIRELSKYPR